MNNNSENKVEAPVSENKFEALVDTIKGNKNINEFKEIDNSGNLKEVTLNGDYNDNMITYSYLVQFYNLYRPLYEESKANVLIQENRVRELAANMIRMTQNFLNQYTRPFCENIFSYDGELEKSKNILRGVSKNKPSFSDIPFIDIHNFVRGNTGGKPKSNKKRKTNNRKKTKARKNNKRRKTKSKTNKRKKRTRRRR